MEKSPIAQAIKMICDEKGIPEALVIETIEAALAAAYRKDFGQPNQNIKVEFDAETGGSKVFDVKTVIEDMELPTEEELKKMAEEKVAKREALAKEIEEKKAKGEEIKPAQQEAEEKRFNPKTDVMLTEALKIKDDAKVGDVITTKLEVPASYGRMAAQTAKQVITQKLREAERNTIFQEYKTKEGQIVMGIVQRREGRVVLIDLGKTVGILPQEEQVEGERYISGQRVKVYILSVNLGPKGPEILLSRAHPEVVKQLFVLEIPEISNGSIEIKSIAREAGFRSKVAVQALKENIDPIGSCVGQRGTRIQTIIAELGGEKIDVIEYSDDISQFIANSLSPAKVTSLEINEAEKTSVVTVAEDQLSLAIGKAGQNVRLAAKLTGWKINIRGEKSGEAASSDAVPAGAAPAQGESVAPEPAPSTPTPVETLAAPTETPAKTAADEKAPNESKTQ